MSQEYLTAKAVAIYFFEGTEDDPTPNMFARTMSDIKKLQDKYTLEHIIKVIDYIRDVKKINMYSFGYVTVTIKDMSKELLALEYVAKAKIEKDKMKNYNPEVKTIDTKASNTSKAERFGVEFGFRKHDELFDKE